MDKQREGSALRPDAQAFDEIRIVTVPRYKMSGMSGDEWRISARVEFYRKGRKVYEDTGGRNIEMAAHLLSHTYLMAVDNANGYFAGDGLTCDQEGCSQVATVTYRRKFQYCREGHKTDVPAMSALRYFCDEHKTRGDCGLDDADANYEPVTHAPVR